MKGDKKMCKKMWLIFFVGLFAVESVFGSVFLLTIKNSSDNEIKLNVDKFIDSPKDCIKYYGLPKISIKPDESLKVSLTKKTSQQCSSSIISDVVPITKEIRTYYQFDLTSDAEDYTTINCGNDYYNFCTKSVNIKKNNNHSFDITINNFEPY